MRGEGELSIPLAPDAERFLRWTVGDREQHRVPAADHAVLVTLPRRYYEHIVDAPLERLAVDQGRAAAFDDAEDCAIGRAVGFALEAFRQQREVRAHRRQHGTAVDRIGVAHAGAVSLVYVAGLLQPLPNRFHLPVRIIDPRRTQALPGGTVRRPAPPITSEG